MATNLPPTSSAVNIQIIEPKNFAGGAYPGQINTGNPVASPYATPASTGAANGSYPSNYNNMFPAYTPQQQLQNAYLEALNARNAAEQARNAYLNIANQANSAAAFNPVYPQFQQQAPGGYPGQINQPINYAMPGYQQPGYPPGYPPMMPPSYGMPPGYAPAGYAPLDPNQAGPQTQQPQPPTAPETTPSTEPQAPSLKNLGIDELNRLVDQPNTLQERVDAMEELGVRGQGTPQTFDLLKREALADTRNLSGPALEDANYVRQAALWTLGMLNKSQNAGVPTDKLPGITAIKQILNNKSESPDVRAAAIQSLQVLGRPDDKVIKSLVKAAAKDSNPDVRRVAQDTLAGKGLPINPGS